MTTAFLQKTHPYTVWLKLSDDGRDAFFAWFDQQPDENFIIGSREHHGRNIDWMRAWKPGVYDDLGAPVIWCKNEEDCLWLKLRFG